MMRLLPASILIALILSATATAAPSGGFPGTKTAKDRAAWRGVLHWSRACERDFGRTASAGVVVYPTGTPRWLVAVTCIQGAYQGTQLLYLVDRGLNRIGPIPLHACRDLGRGKPRPIRTTMVLGTIAFNRGTSRLVVLDKFRGAGDCGILSIFRLQKQRFYPLAVRAKVNCDGKPPFDPYRWPLLPLPHGP
jgi:uncharacterized protein DUF1176